MQLQPLIAVQDISISREWYAAILGLSSGHGGDAYERMMLADRIMLQLHRWDAHDHPHIGNASEAVGNGVTLWFQINQFDFILENINRYQATILEGPQVNQNAHHREVWLQDPDGYTVVIAGAPGDI